MTVLHATTIHTLMFRVRSLCSSQAGTVINEQVANKIIKDFKVGTSASAPPESLLQSIA